MAIPTLTTLKTDVKARLATDTITDTLWETVQRDADAQISLDLRARSFEVTSNIIPKSAAVKLFDGATTSQMPSIDGPNGSSNLLFGLSTNIRLRGVVDLFWSTIGSPPMTRVTPSELYAMPEAAETGVPRYYALVPDTEGDSITFAPAPPPDNTTPVFLVLAVTQYDATPETMAKYPGALVACYTWKAAEILQDLERAAIYQQQYRQAVAEINVQASMAGVSVPWKRIRDRSQMIW
jgi:hypothetical protein